MMVEVDISVQIILNGRPAVRGACPVCGAFVFRMGKPQWDMHTGLVTDTMTTDPFPIGCRVPLDPYSIQVRVPYINGPSPFLASIVQLIIK